MLLKDYPVINSKKTDHASNNQKEAAWRVLTTVFNSDATRYRSTKQLQQKYNNLKKTARKVPSYFISMSLLQLDALMQSLISILIQEMAAEKYGRRQTGDGPAPPQSSETTEWLNSVMGESISGLQAV